MLSYISANRSVLGRVINSMNKTKIQHISWYLDGRKALQKIHQAAAAGSHWPTQSLHVLSGVSATRRRGHCLRRLDDDRLLLQPAPLRHGLTE